MAWLDEVKELVDRGAEAHRNGDWIGVLVFWVFALVMTAIVVALGVGFYLWFDGSS